jgi:epoxyqueuosine reductase QueG
MVTQSVLAAKARAAGCALFGVASLSRIDTSDFLLDADLLRALPFALSIAVPVSRTVLATIHDHPNQLYFHHYRQLNARLDRASLALVQDIEAAGYQALAIAASQIVDWKNQRAHVSHKRIAAAAGLGWLGRNNLLVTPEYGSQVRLATVLTDLPLTAEATSPIAPVDSARFADRKTPASSCGECRTCVARCPARAIHDTSAEFEHQACFAKLKEFQKQGHAGQFICGICVKACPGRQAGSG